jgi:hypothetical protein
MNRQSLIRTCKSLCIAATGIIALNGMAARGAEETTVIANVASIANPSANPAITPSLPPPGRVIKRPGARNAAPSMPLPPSTFKLPAEFSILNKRTIFAKDGVPGATGTAGPAKPEELFALRGIVFDEQSFLIFIEDTAAHRIMQLRPGDPVAGGKVGLICIDDFSFEAGGASKRISVGQNLLGTQLPPVTPAPPQPPPGTQQASGPNAPDKNAKPPAMDAPPNGQRVRNATTERAAG